MSRGVIIGHYLAEFGRTLNDQAISGSVVGMNSLERADVLDFSDNHQYLPPIQSKSLINFILQEGLNHLIILFAARKSVVCFTFVFEKLNIKKIEFSQRQDVVRAEELVKSSREC